VDATSWTVLSLFGSWVAKKTLDSLYTRLTSRGRSLKQALIDAAKSALERDPALARHCEDIPTVAEEVVERLRESALIQACLADDPRALVDHLQRTGGILLPGFKGTEADAASLLRGAMQAALGGLLKAIGSDEVLAREFELYVAQQQAAEHAQQDAKLGQILVGVEELVAKSREVWAEAPGTSAQQLVAQDRQEDLVAEIRQVLDQQGQEKLDAAKEALDRRDVGVVQRSADELGRWLRDRGDRVSGEVRGRIFMFLANVAVAEEFEVSGGPQVDTARAWKYQRAALDAFGEKPLAEDAERLNALTARLMFIDGKGEEALRRLEDSESPHAVVMRMAILLDMERAAEAADLAGRLSPHERWVHLAIGASVRAGKDEEADSLLEWALTQAKGTTRERSALFYATERLRTLLVRRFGGGPSRPDRLTDDDRNVLRELRKTLAPLTQASLKTGRPSTGLEAEALSLFVKIAFLLQDRDLGTSVARALAEFIPVQLDFGQAVLYGFVECPEDLPTRLRQDRPRSFDAGLLAAYLESDVQGKHSEAFQALKSLESLAEKTEHKERLATMIYEVAQKIGDEAAQEGRELVEHLVGRDHRLARLITAGQHVRQGELDEATAILDAAPGESDSIWLQLRGHIARERQDWPAALDCFRKAADLVPHPDVRRRLAEAAFKCNQNDLAAKTLEQVCQEDPKDWQSWWNLAQTYARLAKQDRAAQAFGRVAELRPEETAATLNEARSLAWAGKLDKAVEILDAKCSAEHAPLEAVLLRAHLLHVAGRPDRAMESLVPHRRVFWEEPQYLLAYLSLGYAANREKEAHEAFLHLLELQKKGQVSSEYLQPKQLEEVKRWFKSRQAFLEEVNRLYLAGRIPWVFVEELKNRATCGGWAIRTQDLWVSDDPQACAETTIYATHGFRISQDPLSRRALWPLETPKRGSDIVTDISALITLHRLGLLEIVPRYFGRILVPDLYRGIALRDWERLQPHQPSQIEAAETIVEALDGGKISVHQSPESARLASEAYLCEYLDEAPEGIRIVRLGQLTRWLRAKGALSDKTFMSVQQVCHAKPVTDDEDAERFLASGALTVELHTLYTLHGQGLFDTFLDSFRVFLLAADAREARWEAISVTYGAQVLQWHRGMFELLRANPQIEFVPVTFPGSPAKDDRQLAEHVCYAMVATQCALERKLPLFADDRHCQAAFMNAPGTDGVAMFGSDVLISALTQEDLIDAEKQADAFLQLVKWRYKFLVPPVEVLLTLAKRHLSHPPGEPLREVSRYAHACMRDAGLLLGKERTDPPMSMGIRLFTGWLRVLGEFVIDVYRDPDINKEAAQDLVVWAFRECLPGVPLGLPLMGRRILDQMAAQLVFEQAFTRALLLNDRRVAHETVRHLACLLGMSDEEYDEYAAHAMSAWESGTENAETDESKAVLRRMFGIAVGDADQASYRFLPVGEKLGLVLSGEQPAAPPADDLKAMTEPTHPRRVDVGPGPFLFLKGLDETKREISVSFMPETVLAHQAEVRRTGIDFLETEARGCFLSSQNEGLLEECAGEVVEQTSAKWVSVASRLFGSVAVDFQLNAAGYKQSLIGNYKEGRQRCFPLMLAPSVDSLLSVHDDGYRFLTKPEELTNELRERVPRGAAILEFLDCYETLVGHIPLCEPLDLGSQLREWLSDSSQTGQIWDALWAWVASARNNPWRTYHACRAIITCPEWIPEGRTTEFWEKAGSIIALLRENPDASSEVQLWLLRSRLAAHYLRYLEVNSVAIDPARLVTVAWWAAGKAADSLTFGMPVDPQTMAEIKAWLAGPLPPNFWKWTLTWGMTRTCVSCSAPRYVTLSLQHPWAIAFLTALGRKIDRLHLEQTTAEQRECLTLSYGLSLLLAPSAIVRQPERSLWEWDKPLREAATRWIEALPESERSEGLVHALHLAESTATDKAADQLLGLLADADAKNALLMAMMVRTLCFCRDGFAQSVWDRLHDDSWWAKCTASLPPDAIAVLGDALAELQGMTGGRWYLELPYLWLTAVEANINDPKRLECLLAVFMDSSLAAMTASPIQRLLRSEHLPKVRNLLVEARNRLTELLAVVDRRFAGPLRDILSSLASL